MVLFVFSEGWFEAGDFKFESWFEAGDFKLENLNLLVYIIFNNIAITN